MFPTLGMGELLLVLALVLLLFGPGKLPQVAQSLGEAVNRFRHGTKKIEASTEGVPMEKGTCPTEEHQPPST